MYGKSRLAYNSKPPSSGVTGPSIRGADQQNPAYVGNSPITNGQTIDVVDDPRPQIHQPATCAWN